jgi:hypothetical protein
LKDTLHYYSPRVDLVTNISDFKITNYEARVSVNFQKMLSRRAFGFLKKEDPVGIHAHIQPDTRLSTQHKKKCPPHIGYNLD